MKPTIGILDKRFSYTSASQTDLRKRFKAIKRQQQQQSQSRPSSVVQPLRKVK